MAPRGTGERNCMSYSLNCLEGGYIWGYITREQCRTTKGDAKSLDHISYGKQEAKQM